MVRTPENNEIYIPIATNLCISRIYEPHCKKMHHPASLNSTSQGKSSKSSHYGENEVRVLNVATTCLCVIKGSDCVYSKIRVLKVATMSVKK